MIKMKLNKFIFGLASIALLAGATSCNDDWEEEQYAHYVSFKAPLDTKGQSVGVTTVYVPFTRFNEDGTPLYGETGLSHYDLPVIISGTTKNPSDLTVHVAKSDTLPILNYERFAQRSELWYQDMTDYADCPESIFIPKGQDIGLYKIKFDFRNIDLADRYVLPLTVVEKPEYGYKRNPRKNYATAMLRVLPYTDFSGMYEASNTRFYLVDSKGNVDTEPGAMTQVMCYTVDESTVFFYAGTFDESSLLRKNFKVYAKFTPQSEGANRGTVEFTCDIPEMKFKQNKEATYTIIEQKDEVQTYILRRTVIINDIDYTFYDTKTSPGSSIGYNVVGSMAMERKLNTQMPIEDQIIFE